MEKALPAIPAKRYFTIGEVSELCGVKPYVLRYWEQEFTQLKPMKRRGNRRYYQHHEVLLIRRIRELLYEQGFTISGARNQLAETGHGARSSPAASAEPPRVTADTAPKAAVEGSAVTADAADAARRASAPAASVAAAVPVAATRVSVPDLREELMAIRELLAVEEVAPIIKGFVGV